MVSDTVHSQKKLSFPGISAVTEVVSLRVSSVPFLVYDILLSIKIEKNGKNVQKKKKCFCFKALGS